MNAYIQLLPTVFVQASAFPGLQAFQAAQAGANAVHLADQWDDEPTRPDRVIPAGLRQQLQSAQAAPAALPANIERELSDRYEVAPQEMRRLKSWMDQRHLRVSHFSKAVDYLSQMRLAEAQERFDDEPTRRIDVRKMRAQLSQSHVGA